MSNKSLREIERIAKTLWMAMNSEKAPKLFRLLYTNKWEELSEDIKNKYKEGSKAIQSHIQAEKRELIERLRSKWYYKGSTKVVKLYEIESELEDLDKD